MKGEPLIRLMAGGEAARSAMALRAERRETKRDARRRARAERTEWRLGLICIFFLMGYGALGARMTMLAASEPQEPRIASSRDGGGAASRAPITDRKGRMLAINLPTWSIYAHPPEMKRAGVTPEEAAALLSGTLSGVPEDRMRTRFEKRKGLVWVKRNATPAELQTVHDLGLPGVHFGRRESRIYPAGRVGAHILGGIIVGEQSVTHAELKGRAGVERALDAMLTDPARDGAPVRLSIDLTAQAALTEVLDDAMENFNAKAAAATLIEAKTGRLVAMVSLPDFDPNDRPNPNDAEIAKTRPLMNRAAEGVYELGSTFKVFTAAQAIEEGFARSSTLIDTKGPIRMGGHKIADFHRMPPKMTLRDVIVESSNIGTSRLALAFGAEAQRAFLTKLGLLETVPLEIAEAAIGAPLLPRRWGRLQSMTISFGHGLATTQLHLAAAYAAMVNGGIRVQPTLLLDQPLPTEADRVIRPETSLAIREMMRAVVFEEKGTGNFAEVPGYEVGGKTGTADKASRGGYSDRKTLSTFAGAFPMSAPEYVLVITLDEAKTFKYGREWRTAGWTAAPTMGAAVRRLAPVLGLRPLPVVDPGEAALAVGSF